MFNHIKKKKKNNLITDQILSNNTFRSPKESSSISLRQKLEKLHSQQRMKIAKNALLNMYGRHHPINYKKQYNFHQKWQEEVYSSDDSNYSVLKHQNLLTNIFFFAIVLLSGLIVWYLSIFRLFRIQMSVISSLSTVGALTQILDYIMNYLLFVKKEKKENEKLEQKIISILWMSLTNILLFLYFIIILIFNNFVGEGDKIFYIVDLMFLVVAYRRYSYLYSIVKIKILSSEYRNELQVFQLFVGCLMRIHVFSLILYMVSLQNAEHNWTRSIEFFNIDWLSKYIYSLYFACTTMFTVGYGDIIPKNKLEIVTIIFTQVFGVINIGYIISEIGRFLSKINENQQILYKNISQAEKVAQSFILSKELTSKVRNFVLKNSLNNHQVNLQQENHFLYQLTDEVRQDIKSYSQFNVIKTSIFFICNWSKLLQKKVANCLIKSIYMPQQTLLQVAGKEKIYILTNGLIDVHLHNHANSKSFRKPIHTIGINPKLQVQSNVYGYSSLISELKIKLKGIAKQYVTCYSISKEDMLRIVMQNQADFEYYHEIRSRICLSKIKEKWQAPEIFNIRQCYNPLPYVIIKKHKLNFNRQFQPRRQHIRDIQRTSLILLKESKSIQSENEYTFSEDQIMGQPNIIFKTRQDNVLNSKERQIRYNQVALNRQCLIIPRTFMRKNYKKKNQDGLSTVQQFVNKKQSMLQSFEGYQIYKNYYRNNNIDKILEKYYNIMKATSFMPSQLTNIKINYRKRTGFATDEIFEKLIKVKLFKQSRTK